MLLTKKVDINITTRNISYFKDKGYLPILNENLNIIINDLARNSRVSIECKT